MDFGFPEHLCIVCFQRKESQNCELCPGAEKVKYGVLIA